MLHPRDEFVSRWVFFRALRKGAYRPFSNSRVGLHRPRSPTHTAWETKNLVDDSVHTATATKIRCDPPQAAAEGRRSAVGLRLGFERQKARRPCESAQIGEEESISAWCRVGLLLLGLGLGK